jgi:hypothetical protein
MLPPDQLVSLIWTLPPGAPGGLTTAQQDFANLRASGVKRIEIVAPFGTPGLLKKLREEYGIVHVAVRLNVGDWDNSTNRWKWHTYFQQNLPFIDTCVLGAEVDSQYDARFTSPNWGEKRAEQVRDAIFALLKEWDDLIKAGLRVVSPAVMYRGHFRDWREGLQPGTTRWYEILRNAANACHSNAAHVYGADGTAYDTYERVRVGMWLAEDNANKDVWLGEVNCDRGTDIEQMTFLVRLLSLLYWTDPVSKDHPERGPWAGSGERLVQFVPFAANGDTKNWGSPNHLIKDIEAYRLLGRLLGGERFYFS